MTDQSVTTGGRLNTAPWSIWAGLLPALPGAALFMVTAIVHVATIDWRGAIARSPIAVRKNADSGLLMAVFLAASVAASPCLLAYDLLSLTLAEVVLLLRAPPLIALRLAAYLLTRLVRSSGPRLTLPFKHQPFHGLRLFTVLAGPTPPPI